MMGWRFLLKGLRWQLMLAMTTVAMTVAAQVVYCALSARIKAPAIALLRDALG